MVRRHQEPRATKSASAWIAYVVNGGGGCCGGEKSGESGVYGMWGKTTVTRGCDSIVVQVRMRPGPELDLVGPGPAGGQGGGRRGKRGRSRQGERQGVPVVFEGAQLLVQPLQLSVLLGLKRHHLLNVPVT